MLRKRSHRESLNRRDIIRSGEDVRKALKGKTVLTETVIAYFLSDGERKVGFLVPKRIGRPVIRNLMKRRMRETYRRNRDSFPKGKIIFAPTREAGWDELVRDLALCARELVEKDA